MKPLYEQSLFDFRPPQTSLEGNAWRSQSFTTGETLESIEASVRTYNISSVTLIFAAWALVLAKYSRSSFASFYLSRSGQMIPWPLAPSLVAAIHCRIPFTTGIPAEATVHKWLAELHSSLLRVAELENLCQSLETSIYPMEDVRTGVQAFLYIPQMPANWEVGSRQAYWSGTVGRDGLESSVNKQWGRYGRSRD